MEPLKPRPRTSQMTFWSRYDPIRQPVGNTDHWSKFRQKTTYQISFGDKLYDVQYTDNDGLRSSMPNMRPRYNTAPRTMLRSAYNNRAKEGFRYWLIDRPKPTNFGKYGIGSYKTVLGIGNAPRT